MTKKNQIAEPTQRDYDIINGKINTTYNERMAAYVRIDNKESNNAINKQLEHPSILDQPAGSIEFGFGEDDDDPVDPKLFKETPEEKRRNDKIIAKLDADLRKKGIVHD